MILNSLKKDNCNYLDVARFVGIYLVVFAHITLVYQYSFLSYMIYAFHMPLFFVISGILHKNTSQSFLVAFKIFYSLLIPFIIYNGVCFIFLMIKQKTFNPFGNGVIQIFTIQTVVSGATWFFISLFWVKMLSLFLHRKTQFLIVGITCLLMVACLMSFFPDTPNYFMFKTSILAFPFYAFGYLIKDKLEFKLRAIYKILFTVVSILLIYYVVTQYTSISMAEFSYPNIILNTVMALIGSMSVIFISQLLQPFVKCQFIWDMSRGSMIVVGLHFFIMFQILPSVFFGAKSLKFAIVASALLLLFFYPLIKLTYMTLPVLYGKSRQKANYTEINKEQND